MRKLNTMNAFLKEECIILPELTPTQLSVLIEKKDRLFMRECKLSEQTTEARELFKKIIQDRNVCDKE